MRRRRPPARRRGRRRPLPHQITIGQMYVQFQIPAKKYAGGWPVIMVHGSSHTAACLESTPDGREGWYPYFVRKGVPTYIVDQAGRGRSGFDESVIHEGEAKIVGRRRQRRDGADSRVRPDHRRRRLDQLVRPSRAGELDDPDRHADSPRRPRRSQSQPGRLQARRNRCSRSRAVDAGIVVAGRRHRAGAGGTERQLRARVLQAAGAERRGHAARARRAPTCDPSNIAPANTWTPHNLASLVERLGGAIVVTHSQSGIMGHHMTRILKERGHLDLLKGLVTLEGSCSLPNSGLTAADFDNIPYMALKGDYTATSMVCSDTVNAINARRAAKQGTAKADYIKLDDMGILGVTHMMMLDKKNLEIADVIYGWLDKNVRASGKAPVTRSARR